MNEKFVVVLLKTNILQTFLPLGSMYVNRMLDLTSFDFLVFPVLVMYSHSSCFHYFQCSLMFLLKFSSSIGLSLFISSQLFKINFLLLAPCWVIVRIQKRGNQSKNRFVNFINTKMQCWTGWEMIIQLNG